MFYGFNIFFLIFRPEFPKINYLKLFLGSTSFRIVTDTYMFLYFSVSLFMTKQKIGLRGLLIFLDLVLVRDTVSHLEIDQYEDA